MASKKKGTLAAAQTTFMRAMRDFEKAVKGLVSSPATKTKAKKKAKTKSKKKTKNAKTRSR